MATWTAYLQSIAEVATALGVLFAGWQLLLAKRQSTTEFEDTLSREYRDIAQTLPVEALLGAPLAAAELKAALDDFYQYVDLSNEQIFLRMNGRVTRATWVNWADGIRSNLSRPAFRAAWDEIARRAPDSFTELRRLEASDFKTDPRSWRRERAGSERVSPGIGAAEGAGGGLAEAKSPERRGASPTVLRTHALSL